MLELRVIEESGEEGGSFAALEIYSATTASAPPCADADGTTGTYMRMLTGKSSESELANEKGSISGACALDLGKRVKVLEEGRVLL